MNQEALDLLLAMLSMLQTGEAANAAPVTSDRFVLGRSGLPGEEGMVAEIAEDDGEEQPCAWLWTISMENSSYQRQQVTSARLRRFHCAADGAAV